MSAGAPTSPARPQLLARLREAAGWDVIVIGGGATGLGAAVDAAARGYRTLLLEGHDFAKGTSSRSTKLVHGGVRYLEQGNLHLVREALRERGLLQRNAPHLVQKLGFVIPAYRWWERFFYGAGLTLYDLLAGRLGLGRCRWLSKKEALAHTPTLQPQGLSGGILYYDGQFDDARLAITLLRTLLNLGGVALNYLPVKGLLKEEGRITGVQARDAETGEQFTLRARAVVNATGVFVDAIRQLDEPATPALLTPSQGIHIVVDRRFQPGQAAVMIPKTEDGRVLFALPWHGRVVLGTTDTPVQEAALEPRALEEEIDFVLRTAGRYLTPAPTRADVRSIYVGQRPLVKAEQTDGAGSTAALSRDHLIRVSDAGLITITGGKWTTYRRMGEDVVDEAIRVGGLAAHPCRTAELRLHGHTEQRSGAFMDVYGTDAAAVNALPGADHVLDPALGITEAQVRWAARQELARTVEDVLARRTRALLLDAQASLVLTPIIAGILAEELGKSASWQEGQNREYVHLASGYYLG